MDELTMRIARYKQQGFYCSQILILMGLEQRGQENPDLVRVMHGAAGGLCGSGELCGALIGGTCLLALYAGRGRASEVENPLLAAMAQDLTAWFKETYGVPFGGIRCDDILAGNPSNKARCGQMVRGVYEKVQALLVENGFDPYEVVA
ncbi:MAG: C_GCAxxG_C_C family protein [Anaerolineae bacterium]|nr:C_GCAxxG_C_C family protein [Anaerolineae bacterium]